MQPVAARAEKRCTIYDAEALSYEASTLHPVDANCKHIENNERNYFFAVGNMLRFEQQGGMQESQTL